MIFVVVGTRPEIIKMSPIIRYCQKEKVPYKMIHTGQHYSINMDRIFFDELALPHPEYALDVGQQSSYQGKQTGLMIAGIEEILLNDKPDIVLVQGDTNSVLAGALAASKLHIRIGHVEAGLRSYDRMMPEETNRVITDHISDHLFCPTDDSAENCRKEGIEEKHLHITGNTIVDAAYQNLEISQKNSNILEELGLQENGFILVTSHRAENVDHKERFTNIMSAFQEMDLPVIYPIHPRARKMAENFGILPEDDMNLRIIEPIGYLDFLKLEKTARLILTDSGGLQEEGCILKTPCLTLRENTERPETITAGANRLVGWKKEDILNAYKEEMASEKKKEFGNPFGDGTSAEKIVRISTEKDIGD